MGGSSSKSQTVGYWYHLGVQMAVSHSPIDYVSQLVFGERTAWIGNINNGNIYINERELFGGEKREGGVEGMVSINSGLPHQQLNPYVRAVRGSTSAQRGILSLVFGDVGSGAPAAQLGALDFNASVMSSAIEYSLGYQPTGILSNPLHEMTKEQAYTYISQFYPQGVALYFNEEKNAEVDPLEEQKKIYGTYKAVALMYAYRAFVVGNLISNPKIKVTSEQFFATEVRDNATDLRYTRPFTWAAMNPYFKPVWVRVTNILSGWRGNSEAWYSQKAVIKGSVHVTEKGNIQCDDMNPAHIIYKVLTNDSWGMGYNTHDIDDESFRKAADTLYDEKFGLSVMWQQEESIEDFIGSILDCIDGALRINVITGKFELILIRNNYDVASLPVLNEDNIVELSKFERAAWGDSPNEIILTYSDRNEDKAVVTVQNLAAIEIQGSVISSTQTYHQIHEPELAARVAARELQVLSTPLAKIELQANRVAFMLQSGDLFNLNWEALGIENMPCRVLSVTRGTLDDGVISIEAIEDVFGMPQQTYVDTQPSPTTNYGVHKPVPIGNALIWEAPYYDVVSYIGEQAMRTADVTNGNAFVRYFADQPTHLSTNFDALVSNTDSEKSSFKLALKSQSYTPNFILADNINRVQTRFATTSIENLPSEIGKSSYIVIDNECMQIVRIDVQSGIIEVQRGIFDTIPENHYMGAKGWITSPTDAVDETYFTQNETIRLRPLSNSTRGTLAFENSAEFTKTLVGRAYRPYPVAGVRLNNVYFPTVLPNNRPLQLSWNARNRTMTTTAQHWYFGEVGSEADVKYNIRIFDAEADKLIIEYKDYEQTYLEVPTPLQKLRFTPPFESELVYHVNFENKTSNGFPVMGNVNGNADFSINEVPRTLPSDAVRVGAIGNLNAFHVKTGYSLSLPFDASKVSNIPMTIGIRFYLGDLGTRFNENANIFKMIDHEGNDFVRMWITGSGNMGINFGTKIPSETTVSLNLTPHTWHDFLISCNNQNGKIIIWQNNQVVKELTLAAWDRTKDGFKVVPTGGNAILGAVKNDGSYGNITIDDFFLYNRAYDGNNATIILNRMAARKWQEKLRIEMNTVRNNITSWQTFKHTWQTRS